MPEVSVRIEVALLPALLIPAPASWNTVGPAPDVPRLPRTMLVAAGSAAPMSIVTVSVAASDILKFSPLLVTIMVDGRPRISPVPPPLIPTKVALKEPIARVPVKPEPLPLWPPLASRNAAVVPATSVSVPEVELLSSTTPSVAAGEQEHAPPPDVADHTVVVLL